MRRSSTCKRLADICAPALFRTITNPKRHEELVNLLDYLVNIGRFVRHLKLHLQGMEDLNLAEIVKRCSDLRCLTIHHCDRVKSNLVQLLAAIMLLPALTELCFEESPLYRDNAVRSNGVIRKMIEPLLRVHGDKLRSLKVSGHDSLGSGGLVSLTRDASRLVELELYIVLDVGLRRSLAESSTWACAAHLQSLTFVRCGGLHANIFTRKLASGVFGRPREVSLTTCGNSSDDRKPPGPIEWTIPALDTLKLDHFETWEMEHLQLIHAKKVFLSRVWSQGSEGKYKMVIQQIAHKRAFPEATEVHFRPSWSDKDFIALQRVCSARGVRMITRDWDQQRTMD